MAVLAAAAMLIVLSASSTAQGQAASIKRVSSFAYVCVTHKGPLTDMSRVITELMQLMQDQKIFPKVRGPMIGVYFNAPGQVKPEELIWEVGYPVPRGLEAQVPLIRKVWTNKTVAAALQLGPYSKTGETIQKLMDYIGAQKYVVDGPVLERYLNNPMQVKPEELQTEIWIPCKKK
jgi:effector-binding domain-containing protein